ncbi:MAG: hypothetical protein D6689_01255 [Deltaproteobacteria bacterium]|nr:MAG: hypothetical protein D6689_01255 [Deltaproteobacteria bacterium]
MIRGAALAAVCAASAAARADDAIFDFVAPRPGQVGAYETTGGAIVSGGVGTLGPKAGWFDERWRYRVALSVANPTGAALAEWPVSVAIDATVPPGNDIFALGQPTGADLRVVAGGSAIDRASLGAFDLSDNRGRIWFQAPSLAPGDNAMSLYFGNYTVAAVDDPLAVFSYSSPYASRYALEPDGITMTIASLADANAFSVGAISGTLVAGGTSDITAGNWTVGAAIAATRPFDVGFPVDAASQGVPIAFARTELAAVINRGSPDHFRLLAPFSDATVDVYYDGVLQGSLALTAGAAGVWEDTIPADTVVRLSATAPILATYRGLDGVDGVVLPPAGSQVWGVRSGRPRIHALGGDTDVVAYSSNGTIETVTIPGGGVATLASGTSGNGDALVLYATDTATGAPAPITVIANGDGDGGAAIAFHPESELGRAWVVPTDGRFATIASNGPGSKCTLTEPDGTTVEQFATTAWPAVVQFGDDGGAVNVPAGSVIACEAHGFAFYEDAATQDERNLFPMEAHRKAAAVDPIVSLSGPTETRFDAGALATIDTPDAVAATAVERWTDFRVAHAVPDGAAIGYQISIDSGSTYRVPDGSGAWREVTGVDDVADPLAIRGAIGALDPSTGRIRVRAVLRSTDGVARPAVDAIRVFFDATGAATRLQFDPLPDTIVAGVGVTVGVTAVDAAGRRITGLDGQVVLSASHGGDVIPQTIDLVAGRAEADIKLTGAGDDVTLHAAGPGGLAGTSEPFDLVAPDGATLTVVGGDNQFGPAGSPLGEPLAVRLTGAAGVPIGGAQVTFSVVEGDGVLLPAGTTSTAAITDGQGIASVRLQLGSVGPHRVRAEAAGDQVEFRARADEPGATAGDGGCGCRTTGRPAGAPGGMLAAIAAAAWLAARRRWT